MQLVTIGHSWIRQSIITQHSGE